MAKKNYRDKITHLKLHISVYLLLERHEKQYEVKFSSLMLFLVKWIIYNVGISLPSHWNNIVYIDTNNTRVYQMQITHPVVNQQSS